MAESVQVVATPTCDLRPVERGPENAAGRRGFLVKTPRQPCGNCDYISALGVQATLAADPDIAPFWRALLFGRHLARTVVALESQAETASKLGCLGRNPILFQTLKFECMRRRKGSVIGAAKATGRQAPPSLMRHEEKKQLPLDRASYRSSMVTSLDSPSNVILHLRMMSIPIKQEKFGSRKKSAETIRVGSYGRKLVPGKLIDPACSPQRIVVPSTLRSVSGLV